jgi:magnesium-transporting ATPase (P-type)
MPTGWAAPVICTDKTGTLSENRMSPTGSMISYGIPRGLLAVARREAEAQLECIDAVQGLIEAGIAMGRFFLYLYS